jgi:alpha-beta hydrolase superfamily lysophospholipase
MNTNIIKTHDDLSLKVYPFNMVKPEMNIIFVHGYTDHSGRYQELRKRLNNHKISVVFYDQRGYGQSEGRRAFVKDFNLYLKDLHLVVEKFFIPGIPNLLMGASMGGAIISKYLIDYGENNIAGAVLLSPMLKISENVAPFLRKLSKFLALVVPGLKTIRLESDALSRDPRVVKAYEEDPLVYHGGAIVRTGVEFLKSIQYIQDNLAKITLPLLVMHGTADRLTDPKGSSNFIENISTHDKMLLEYPGLFHELLNEPEKEQVYNDLFAWLRNRDRWLKADTGKEIA